MNNEKLFAGIEGKYTLDYGNYDLVLSSLNALCIPDPNYYKGQINSVYFDSVDLQLLKEKVASDYEKTKVRLRWYGTLEDKNCEDSTVSSYLEIKRKEGAQRLKRRIELKMNNTVFREGNEDYRVLASISQHVSELGWTAKSPLFPMITIRYMRYRFIEPISGARIALDTNIRFSSINTLFFPGGWPAKLRHGVVEIKSKTGELPETLLPIRHQLNIKDSFSKYEECWNLYGEFGYRRALTSTGQ